MTKRPPAHQARPYRSALPGVEAVSLTSERHFPRHAHDHFGIGVIRAGGHRSWSGVGSVEAGRGDVITVNPGEMHDGAPADDRGRSWTMLYLEPSVVASMMAGEMPDTIEIARPVISDAALARRVAGLFRSLTAGGADTIAAEERLVGLLASLGRYVARAAAVTPASPRVARAVARLDEAPAEPVTLGDLAALAGVSRFQLLRGFSREVGTTPHAYLIQRRVRLARQLLAAGCGPAEAAAAAGFADQSHLTRAFVRQLGVTPARYRRAVT